jgi:hypothetical protein
MLVMGGTYIINIFINIIINIANFNIFLYLKEFYNANCSEKPLEEVQTLQFFNGINNTFPDHFKQHLVKGLGCVADRGRAYSILTFLGRDCDFFDAVLSKDFFDRDAFRHVFFGATKSVYMMHGLGCSHRDLSLENICKFYYAFYLFI